jgi:hypothetical protein
VSELGEACRECGWVPAPRPKAVAVQGAELGELLESDAARLTQQAPEVAQFYREAVCWYGLRWPDRWRERPKSGRWWAWSQTRQKFGFSEQLGMPRSFWDMAPTPTTEPVNGWLKSQMIRYAKRRRAA